MAEYLKNIYNQLLQHNTPEDVEMAMQVIQCNKHRLLTTPITDLLPVNVKL